MPLKQPWELNPTLTSKRIKEIASFIRDVRDDVADRHDDELGDTARSTGLRAYECCRSRIIREAATTPWLGVVKSDGRFTFSIDSVPVRLYRGRPDSPEERRLIPSYEALSQMTLLSEEIGNAASILWFFAVEIDELRYVDRVTFTGFLDGTQVSYWEIPLDEKVSALSSVDTALPEPVKIQKASVSIKKKSGKSLYGETHNG